MAPQLRALTALGEDLSSIPSTHIRELTAAAGNFWSPWVPALMCTYSQRHVHIYIYLKLETL